MEKEGIRPASPSWSESVTTSRYKAKIPTSCFHFSAVHRFSLKPREQPSLRFLFWPNHLISQSISLRVFLLSHSHVFRSQPTDAPEAVTLLNTDGQDRTRVLPYEVTFSPYVMTPGEKLVLNTIVVVLLSLLIIGMVTYLPKLVVRTAIKLVYFYAGANDKLSVSSTAAILHENELDEGL